MTDIVTDPTGIIAAWRARIEQLGIGYETVDLLSGMTTGYCAQLMSGAKKPGRKSFELMNRALGMGFVAVEDPEQAELMRSRWVKRKRR